MELVLSVLLKPAERLFRIFFLAVFHAPTGKHVKNKYIVVLDNDVTVEQRKVALRLH